MSPWAGPHGPRPMGRWAGLLAQKIAHGLSRTPSNTSIWFLVLNLCKRQKEILAPSCLNMSPSSNSWNRLDRIVWTNKICWKTGLGKSSRCRNKECWVTPQAKPPIWTWYILILVCFVAVADNHDCYYVFFFRQTWQIDENTLSQFKLYESVLK